jgi:hypothetical protein
MLPDQAVQRLGEYSKIKGQTPKDLLNQYELLSTKLYQQFTIILGKYGCRVDPKSGEISTDDLDDLFQNISLNEFVSDWNAHIAESAKCFNDWARIYQLWTAFDAAARKENETCHDEIQIYFDNLPIDRKLLINARWPSDFSPPVQRPPRYELLASMMQKEIASIMTKKLNLTTDELLKESAEYSLLTQFVSHCQSFSQQYNIIQGRVSYEMSHPNEESVFMFTKIDDVSKQKSRDLLVTSSVVQEIRDDAGLFTNKTRVSIEHKDIVMVLRSTAQNDQEFGTIIISAPILDINAPNIVVSQVAQWVKDQNAITFDGPISELLKLESVEPILYKITTPLAETKTHFLKNVPKLSEPLSTPRPIYVIKANLHSLALKVPQPDNAKSTRRRSSLGGDQHKDNGNVIQLFSYNTIDPSKNEAQIAAHFSARTPFVDTMVQIMCNTQPAQLIASPSNQPVVRHKRRLSFFSSSNAAANEEINTPSHSAQSNSGASIFQSEPSTTRPIPVEDYNTVNTSVVPKIATKRRSAEHSIAVKRRSQEFTAPADNTQVSIDVVQVEDSTTAAPTAPTAPTAPLPCRPLNRSAMTKLNTLPSAASQAIATPGAGPAAARSYRTFKRDAFKKPPQQEQSDANTANTANTAAGVPAGEMGQDNCNQQ